MKNMDLKYIVRYIPPRLDMVADIRQEIGDDLIQYCDPFFYDSSTTGGTRAYSAFLAALNIARNEPSIHLEDDVLLCRDFKRKALHEIQQRPDSLIQFFSMRRADLIKGSRWDNNFIMAQCFYLPAGWAPELHEFGVYWEGRNEAPGGLDLMVNDFLKYKKRKYWIVVPNLADHRRSVSAIEPRRPRNRVSKTFVG